MSRALDEEKIERVESVRVRDGDVAWKKFMNTRLHLGGLNSYAYKVVKPPELLIIHPVPPFIYIFQSKYAAETYL